ncbi:MAG: hypothetical protein KC549_01320 [Myxococcales bacterium]|nr:hypothetical protein [Myxococcales bacterium]MCB9546621.1 hypothetical protein [Myxococcales bacterium]
MKKFGLFALVVAASSLFVANAHAVDLNGKKGIGYTETINNVNGFNFQFGTGNLILEGILGLTMGSSKDADAMGRMLTLGLGGHFQALRAEAAAWTIGARINVGNAVGETPKGGDAPDGATEFGLSIPTRVYWFPNKHISLHVETGIDIQFPPKEGAVTSNAAVPEGSTFAIFDFGTGVGMSFWW